MHVFLIVGGVIVLLALLAYGLFKWNTAEDLVIVKAPLPVDFPGDGFSHSSFEALLARYVNANGKVDYQAWSESREDLGALDSYLAAIAKFSPENASKRFPGKTDALVYWVYGYNALVIKSILLHWPLDSVTDIEAPVEIVKGLGFFYKQRFVVGGEHYNLYQIENSKIFSGDADPRIHFILNCGSGGCPILRPELPTGDALDPFLDQAAREFLDDPANMRFDHGGKTIQISKVFDMYEDHFLSAARTLTKNDDASLIDYLRSIVSPERRDDLDRAREYTISFDEYDWKINQAFGE